MAERHVCISHEYVVDDTNSKSNNRDNGSDVLELEEKMEDDISDAFPSLPVCTSTPYVDRPRPKLLDSVVSILKLDDSGLGDSLKSSPSMCETASPSLLEACSPAVTEEAVRVAFTPSLSSISSVGIQSSRFSQNGEISSSTPISQSQSFASLVKRFALVDEASGLSESPVSSPSFQRHRKSPVLMSTEDCPADTDRFFGSPPAWHDEETQDEAYCSHSKVSEDSGGSSGVRDEACHGADLALSMDRVLRDFSPAVPENLVGRNVGVETVDIIVELHDRSLPASGVIAWLKTYLRPMDFIRMSGVCQRWRRICLQDGSLHRFWKLCTHLHSRPGNKENTSHSKDRGGSRSHCLTRASAYLGGIQDTVPQPVKHHLHPPDLYEKTRRSLRWEEIMRHCPLCQSVAKVRTGQERAVCQNNHCENDFCTRCLSLYHPTTPCQASCARSKKETPGNKKSRKVLKRISSL